MYRQPDFNERSKATASTRSGIKRPRIVLDRLTLGPPETKADVSGTMTSRPMSDARQANIAAHTAMKKMNVRKQKE